MRGSSFLWSPLLQKSGYVSGHMMQIFDWLPTLLSVAGYNMSSLDPSKLDGLDMWRTLSTDDDSPRTEMLLNIDPISGQEAIRVRNYKYLKGESATYWAGWYKPGEHGKKGTDFGLDDFGDTRHNYSVLPHIEHVPDVYVMQDWNVINSKPLSDEMVAILKSLGRAVPEANPVIIHCGEKPANASTNCLPKKAACLFDIDTDPCEYNNIASQYPDIVAQLEGRLNDYRKTMVTPKNKHLKADPKGYPENHHWAWVPWLNTTDV